MKKLILITVLVLPVLAVATENIGSDASQSGPCGFDVVGVSNPTETTQRIASDSDS